MTSLERQSISLINSIPPDWMLKNSERIKNKCQQSLVYGTVPLSEVVLWENMLQAITEELKSQFKELIPIDEFGKYYIPIVLINKLMDIPQDVTSEADNMLYLEID